MDVSRRSDELLKLEFPSVKLKSEIMIDMRSLSVSSEERRLVSSGFQWLREDIYKIIVDASMKISYGMLSNYAVVISTMSPELKRKLG
jgi:hypothetical protein